MFKGNLTAPRNAHKALMLRIKLSNKAKQLKRSAIIKR